MTRDEVKNKTVRHHRELLVWQEAIALVKLVYQISSSFPKEEQFGLTAQMRRAAVSVPSNIEEGAARISRKEFVQFLAIARGSLSELETQIVIAEELGFIADSHSSMAQIERIFRLLNGLMSSLRT